MTSFSRPPDFDDDDPYGPDRSSQRHGSSTRRYLPAVAAVAVVGAVLAAGAAGGLGNDSSSAGSRRPAASSASSTSVAPTTTEPVVVTESTDVPVVKTDLSQPLGYGMAGSEVREVQQRLTDLHFFPGPIDGQFGNLTRMAVWAFEKLVLDVPSDQPTGVVTNEMWQRMQDPIAIEPLRHYSEGQATENHTEVYLPQQVVAFFVDDQPVLISHMSSGTGDEWREVVTIDPGEWGNEHGTEAIKRGEIGVSVTPGGVYHYDRFVEGTRESAARQHVEPGLLQLRDRHPRGHQRAHLPGVARLHPGAVEGGRGVPPVRAQGRPGVRVRRRARAGERGQPAADLQPRRPRLHDDHHDRRAGDHPAAHHRGAGGHPSRHHPAAGHDGAAAGDHAAGDDAAAHHATATSDDGAATTTTVAEPDPPDSPGTG